jgi:hypothetical protein
MTEPVVSIERTLGRLEGKVDAILRNQERIEQRTSAMSDRLRSVEAFKVKVGAFAAVVAGLVSLAMGFLAKVWTP